MAKKVTKAKAAKFIPCHIAELPPERHEEAARLACVENPANAPRLDVLMAAMSVAITGTETAARSFESTVAEPAFLAALTSKYWGPTGVNLTVSFMDNPSVALRNRIMGHFNAWGEFSNVVLSWVQSGGDIRVARNEGGYYSYLGSDIRMIPRNQHTMMLGGFSDRTTESEMRRVAAHELGHSLGFPHEHLRRSLIERLDVNKVLAYFRQTQGWSDATTRSNVLTPLEERSIMGSDLTDDTSLMCYGLPASITRDGKPIPGGGDFSKTDREFANRLYPKAVQPPPPPPPSGAQDRIILKFPPGFRLGDFECTVERHGAAAAVVEVQRGSNG